MNARQKAKKYKRLCGNPYGYSDETLIRATIKVVDMHN